MTHDATATSCTAPLTTTSVCSDIPRRTPSWATVVRLTDRGEALVSARGETESTLVEMLEVAIGTRPGGSARASPTSGQS